MWTDKPIERVVGIAPYGMNGCVLFFEDKTAYGLTPAQQNEHNPAAGDLFTLNEDGSFSITKPKE